MAPNRAAQHSKQCPLLAGVERLADAWCLRPYFDPAIGPDTRLLQREPLHLDAATLLAVSTGRRFPVSVVQLYVVVFDAGVPNPQCRLYR